MKISVAVMYVNFHLLDYMMTNAFGKNKDLLEKAQLPVLKFK